MSESASGSSTTRMPFPPPPADALSRTGKPISSAAARAAAASVTRSVSPGTIGTPASRIRRRASVLSPITAIVAGLGPTKTSPASSTARAKSARSARKP